MGSNAVGLDAVSLMSGQEKSSPPGHCANGIQRQVQIQGTVPIKILH